MVVQTGWVDRSLSWFSVYSKFMFSKEAEGMEQESVYMVDNN